MMSKKSIARIGLSVLLLVLSLFGIIAGVFLIGFAESGTDVFIPPSRYWECAFTDVCGVIFAAVPASFLGVMILLVSSVARCEAPMRHVAVQTLASVLMGALSYFGDLLLHDKWLHVVILGFVAATVLGAGVVWAERKAGWSFRKCSLLLLGMIALLYGSFTAGKWYLDARKERLTCRVFFEPPVSNEEIGVFYNQLIYPSDRGWHRSSHGNNQLYFYPAINSEEILKGVQGYEISKTGWNRFKAKKITGNAIEGVVQPRP